MYIFIQIGSLIGMGDEINTESMTSKMMDILPTIQTINEQFKDAVFVYIYNFRPLNHVVLQPGESLFCTDRAGLLATVHKTGCHQKLRLYD